MISARPLIPNEIPHFVRNDNSHNIGNYHTQKLQEKRSRHNHRIAESVFIALSVRSSTPWLPARSRPCSLVRPERKAWMLMPIRAAGAPGNWDTICCFNGAGRNQRLAGQPCAQHYKVRRLGAPQAIGNFRGRYAVTLAGTRREPYIGID